MKKASIDNKKCVGCGACIVNCSSQAIVMTSGWISKVQQEKCIGCGNCVKICHKKAITLQ